MFYVTAIAPAVVVFVILAVWAWRARRHHWAFTLAALGCLIAALSPWFCMWYVWNVLNDHTANIGAGLLALGQPILAPIGALLGAAIGLMFESVFQRRTSLEQE